MEETILYSPDFPNYSNMPSQLIRQIFCTNQYKPSMEIKEFSQAELELTYKKILKAIVSELNTYHQINLSEKQWETIIGYWLLNFLTGAKDRWTTIEKIERNSLEKTVLIREVPLNFSRNVSHMNDSQLSESSSFNDAIFSQILEYFPDIKIRKLESSFHSPLEKSRPHKKYRFRSRVAWIKNMTSEFIQISARKLTRYKFHKKIFLVDNWVPLNGIFRLSLMCHFPVFNNSNIFHDIEFPGPVLLDRRIHLTRLKAENRFEIFLKDHIVEYFPTSILESFKFQKLRLDKLGLNFTPLMTISDLQHTGGSDLARIWFGLYGNSDSQLVVMQHGGTYGQYRWQSSAYFERRICSKFLSWGWVEQTLEVNQILDIPAIRLMSTRNLDNENHNNKILFLLCPEQHYLSVKLSGQPSDANEFIVYIARIQ